MSAPETTVRKKIINNPRQQTHVVAPSATRDTVSVGCKLPNGMHLDIGREGEPIERVTLKGINSLTEGALIRPAAKFGEYAVTKNVPKEFFEHWMSTHQNHPAVKNHLIFSHAQEESVKDMGEEFSEVKHGFEPLDPNKPAKGITTRQDND